MLRGGEFLRGAAAAWVVFGKADTTTIDLDNLGSAGFKIEGGYARDSSGDVGRRGGRDVNADGRPDVVVGAPFAGERSGGQLSGAVYVVFGRASTDTVIVTRLGSGGFRIDGAAAGEGAGTRSGWPAT